MEIPKKKKWKLAYFSREFLVYIPLVFIVICIVGRLFYMQVYNSDTLTAKGISNRTTSQTLLPERGTISDSKGNVLSRSVLAQEVYANPRGLTTLIQTKKFTRMTKEEIAKSLGEILGQDSKSILAKLNKDVLWINIARQVDLEKIEQIRKLKLPGFGYANESKRIYPLGTWASSVLGFVNQTGHGIGGIEAYYDKTLYGTAGQSMSEKTTSRQEILDANSSIEPPRHGNNLELTLNTKIQTIIEQQLVALQTTTQAESVTILAMDPQTGKILGMGTTPSFDPNKYGEVAPELWTNRAISMNYEPGSTFKIVTGSAGLEEGLISPNELFVDPGYITLGNRTIRNWDFGVRPAGSITFTQGMEQSSNVVMSQMSLRLGATNFYKYLRAFGFGEKTGIDIAGEERGLLVPQQSVKDIDLATMSFGQSNLVTPIQLLTTLCAIVNGGTLYKPYVVDKITTPDGVLVQQNQPTVIRKVISKSTSDEMVKMMESVVINGTGKLTIIPGIRVGGKSGTAQKIDHVTRSYSPTSFIASFEAFAPVDNPKIAVLVIADSPKGVEYEGGPLCSPVAKIILQGALEEFNVPFSNDTKSTILVTEKDVPVRPVTSPSVPERPPLASEVVVPNLIGMTMRQVGETVSKSELHFNFNGSGLAIEQDPVGGKVVAKGVIVEVKFAPLPPAPPLQTPPPTP
ncbi:penicillin-binding transpeptidase domain-containing protein [Desulfosporosinus sp. OT]|uniref:penicillin-binding protein n=1 Tax=Desulfosporosinus sp. OT TaxID=913865 RepID=UPI000223AD27|nr:penicillin-binding transpeptidase domain-containing protein [Desulfosporosinus sp. OT]EGW41095.1 penicillin binding transpeptidase domain protein [Desulfosporosinus sp. OT]